MSKPILCLDFDGVIHSYTSGWKGAGVIPDPPVPGAMDWLREVYESDRVIVAIYSSRSKSIRGRWAMRHWLKENLIAAIGYQAGPHLDPLYLEILEWIRWPWFKPAAFITLDDRALTFTGEWPTIETLLAFKPWNK